MIVLFLTLILSVQAQTTAFRSHSKLVSANGQGVIALTGQEDGTAVLDRFSDRIYKQRAPADGEVRDLLYDAYFGLDGVWLTETLGFGYHFPGSGVMSISRRDDESLAVTEWAWVPMGLDHPGYAHMLEIENRATEAKVVTVNSLHNVHLGDAVGDMMYGDESIWSNGQDLIETGNGTGLGMWFQTTRETSSYTCDRAFENVAAFDGRCGTETEPWDNDDQVGGFQWTITIGPESTEWVDVTAMFFSDHDRTGIEDKRAAWLADVEPANWTLREGGFWNTFHVTVPRPASISDQEYAVLKQSLAFLKMAQVTEPGPAYGQIPASFPVVAEGDTFDNAWNITWVRDQAYAAVALARAGKIEEAEAALAFTLQEKAGGYVDEVGMDYGLSVCRLYGDGSEWSDDVGTGPNIELDNFGLTLWAIGEYVKAGGDSAFLVDYDVMGAVAVPLLNAIDELDLIQADSSIWERHWNGNQKHFTYSTVMAIEGLDTVAGLMDLASYGDGARQLERGLCEQLVHGDLGLLGNAEEEPENAIDLAAVEAFNLGILDAQGPTAMNSFATWEDRLAVANGMGFKRNDDGDVYDEQEWVIMDLRLAEAYRRGCELDKAKAIEGWITSQAFLNTMAIPELLHPETGHYQGPTPMLGFGAGAYVLGLFNREAAALDCSLGIDQTCDDILGIESGDDTGGGGGGGDDGGGGDGDGGDDTGSEGSEDDKGCGCASAHSPSPWFMLPLVVLGLIRRRQIVTDDSP